MARRSVSAQKSGGAEADLFPASAAPREVLEQRIEDARGQLFQAQAIADCAAVALSTDQIKYRKPVMSLVLDQVSDIIDSVCGQLEVLLEKAATQDELEAAGLEGVQS